MPGAGQLRDPAGDRQSMHDPVTISVTTLSCATFENLGMTDPAQSVSLRESRRCQGDQPAEPRACCQHVQSRCGDLGNASQWPPMALDCATMVPAMKTTSVRARKRRHPTTESLMMSGRKKDRRYQGGEPDELGGAMAGNDVTE